MKNIHKKNTVEFLNEKRFIYYFGEAQQKAEIDQKLGEKKAEAERKAAEGEENKPEKVNKIKTRYAGERAEELVKCDLLKKSDSVDPYEKEQAQKKEKRIKDETVEPDKLEGKFLSAKDVNDNMRKLYAILGKDWDQIKAAEEQKEKEDKAKSKEPEVKPDAQPGSPDQPKQPESPDKPKTIKFDSVQYIFGESMDATPDEKIFQARSAVMKEIEAKTVGKEFKNIDEVKTVIQVAINNMDDKTLSALAGKTMKIKAGEYNFSFKFVKPGESPNQKAGVESVSATPIKKPDDKPKEPEVKAEPPEALTRIKFSTLQRLTSSVDKNADANTKEAIAAVMNEIQSKTQGILFETTDDLTKVIKQSMNSLNPKYIAALTGKDIMLKADEYNISFRFVKPGEVPTRPSGVESVSVSKIKPPEAPKPPEAKDKPAEDKSKLVESKEVTELRGEITKQAKQIFEEYSKMSKEDLVKQGLNNGNKLAYEMSVRINNLGIQLSDKLSKLDKTYFLEDPFPSVGKMGFNQNGIYCESMTPFINKLYADKKIEDSTKKETPKAYEYLVKFSEKVTEVSKKFEDKNYITQLGITNFEEFSKKYEQEVATAVGTIDKKLISSIEWKKLEYKTLNNSITSAVYFRLEEGKEPKISPSVSRLRAKWEALNPPAKEEPAPKEEQPKAPVEEKPDPAKFNKIRPTAEAAINRGLALSYEGSMYNDPIGIAMAIKLQLQKLPLQEQYLLPIDYMTPQGIKIERIYSGEKMQVRVTGVTETVARKYVESWEKAPRATAEANEKKWAKVKCVDVYGTEKPKPEGWLMTKEGAKLDKEAKEKKAKEKGDDKPKDAGVQKPEEKPADAESPEVKETRNKVEAGMKKIFDNVSKMSKEDMSAKGVFNILHEMSFATKALEKTLAPDLAKLDKTYTSDKLQPPILIYFNKAGICMEKPEQWVNDQLTAKGALDSVDAKSPNAFNYTKLFTSKMVELKEKYSTQKILTEQGIKNPEDMSKKFNQELQAMMEKADPKMVDKIEWANLPGQTLVYPGYSYASFRLEKGKKVAVSVNEAGIRTLWDKANAPKPAFEATQGEESGKEDAPEKVEKAKSIVNEEVKAIFKKYNDYTPEKLKSENLNNRTILMNAIMSDIKVSDTKLRTMPEISELNKTHQTEAVPKIFVSFNKYGMRPVGLNDWMKNFYKDKKIQDTESKETPNARKAEEKIIETLTKLNARNSTSMDKETLKKQGIDSFALYYKFATEAAKKEIDALGPDLFANIEWDKLPNKTFKSPYTFYAEVKREQNSKESQYTFNYAMYKAEWDEMADKPKPPEEVKKPTAKAQPVKAMEAPIGAPGAKRIPGKMYDKMPTKSPKDAPIGSYQYNDDISSIWVSDGKKWTKVKDDLRP